MGRRNHTKGHRAKAIITAIGLVIAGAVSGAAFVLAGGNAQAAASETSRLCLSGEQLVESLVPLRGLNQPICLPISENRQDGSRVDPNYSRAASAALTEAATLIGGVESQEAIVVCWGHNDWLQIAEWFEAQRTDNIRGAYGFVSMPSNVVNISPYNCRDLDKIVYDAERPEKMVAGNALGVVIHEALHAGGLADEGAAECYAMQLTAQTAVELGTDEAYGATLAELYLDFNHTFRSGSMYDTPECRDEGKFDLDNATLWQ